MKLFWGNTDYNLILEKILDSKYFSSNSKSLLLSMIYKIENCYDDYKRIKRIDKTKEEFLTEIIDYIKKYCDNIKLIEPDSDEAQILKDNNVQALTNERERSMIVYPTEVALLYAISDVSPKYFYIPEGFSYKNAFQHLLVNGYNENNIEVLSDFNGWSWDINSKFKNSIEDNLIYQNLIILFGINFMDEWMSRSDIDVNSFNEVKKFVSNTKYFDYLIQYLNTELSPKDRAKIDKVLVSKIKELEEISDKATYFEKVKRSKMKYLKEVEKIDILLNSKTALRKEYMEKNKKLDTSRRIPTVGTYRKLIEKRRLVCIDKISELGRNINPINYINHKRELEDFINNSGNNSKDKFEIIINLQKEFIKLLKDIVFDTNDIEELKSYLYKIRYYRYIYISNTQEIKDIEILENEINEVLKCIIKKLCDENSIKRISKDNDFNFNIINNILDTKIIELADIRFELDLKDGILLVKTYEKEVFEKKFEIECKYTKKELEVKTDKISKLFV